MKQCQASFQNSFQFWFFQTSRNLELSRFDLYGIVDLRNLKTFRRNCRFLPIGVFFNADLRILSKERCRSKNNIFTKNSKGFLLLEDKFGGKHCLLLLLLTMKAYWFKSMFSTNLSMNVTFQTGPQRSLVGISLAYIRGLQTFLLEGHTRYDTKVRGPDLQNVIVST